MYKEALRPVWAEINLTNLEYNIDGIKEKLSGKKEGKDDKEEKGGIVDTHDIDLLSVFFKYFRTVSENMDSTFTEYIQQFRKSDDCFYTFG